MAPTPEYGDDLLLLIATLLAADRADIDWDELFPYTDRLLDTLERRYAERSDLFSHLSLPPSFFFRELRYALQGRSSKRHSRRLEEMSDSLYGRMSERLDRIERDIDRRFNDANERLDQISFQEGIERNNITELLTSVADDLKTFEWALSIGAQPGELHLRRSVPVRIYLSEPAGDEIHQAIVTATLAILAELSFEKDTEMPEESGSWWKRFWVRTTEVATQEEVAERLQKLERAAEITLLDKPQAAANKDHASAIATLLKALQNSDKACIQAGNILLLKNGDDIIVRTLSPAELRAVERNQALLKQPQQLLRKLQTICEESEDTADIRLPHERKHEAPLKPETKPKKGKDG
jgi:hypothetical protein